jgi:hypothetical protein
VQLPIPPRNDEFQPKPMLPGSVEAGLVAGTAVALALWVRDCSLGEPLHTPSVLGTLLLEGVEAARAVRSEPGVAAAYNILHFAAWILVGFIASLVVRRLARGETGWWMPCLTFAAIMGVYVVADVWIAETALARSRLWIGGLAGVVCLAAYLHWRYPGAVARLRRAPP